MVDLSIIIVSYNTKDYLLKCLSSISKFTSQSLSYEIIVVDNGSGDGTIKAISNFPASPAGRQFPISNFQVIKNKENLGFSKANNIGVKSSKGKYILFLNSDAELVHNDTLEEMVAFMEHHSDAGAATCRVELSDGNLDDASHRGFPTPWNSMCHFSRLDGVFPKSLFFNGYHLGWRDLDKVHEIDALAGAFMIVRREAGERVGWWDEDYFFYGEDLDFCYRLKQEKWKIYFVPTAKILHYKGVSSGIKKHSEKLLERDINSVKAIQEARFDAMRIFYRKHYKNKYPSFITNLVLMGIKLKQKSISIK